MDYKFKRTSKCVDTLKAALPSTFSVENCGAWIRLNCGANHIDVFQNDIVSIFENRVLVNSRELLMDELQ